MIACSAVFAVRVVDPDSDALVAQLLKGIFIRDVVADVNRHHGSAIRLECIFKQPANRPAFVPLDVRLQLKYFFPTGKTQSGPFCVDRFDDFFDSGHVFERDFTIVNRHSKLLAFNATAFDGRQSFSEGFFGAVDFRQKRQGLGVLSALAAGADNVKAMAAGIIQSFDADPLTNVLQIAPADDRHRAPTSQLADDLAGSLGKMGIFGPPHNWRQGAVVIQENG